MNTLYRLHILPYLGISDANYYYNRMAERGWFITGSPFFIDIFKRDYAVHPRLTAIPRKQLALTEEEAGVYTEQLVATTSNYYICRTVGHNATFFPWENLNPLSFWKRFTIAFVYLKILHMIYQRISPALENDIPWIKAFYLIIAGCCMVFCSLILALDHWEIKRLEKTQEFLPFNQQRLSFRLFVSFLIHLTYVAIFLLLLVFLFY